MSKSVDGPKNPMGASENSATPDTSHTAWIRKHVEAGLYSWIGWGATAPHQWYGLESKEIQGETRGSRKESLRHNEPVFQDGPNGEYPTHWRFPTANEVGKYVTSYLCTLRPFLGCAVSPSSFEHAVLSMMTLHGQDYLKVRKDCELWLVPEGSWYHQNGWGFDRPTDENGIGFVLPYFKVKVDQEFLLDLDYTVRSLMLAWKDVKYLPAESDGAEEWAGSIIGDVGPVTSTPPERLSGMLEDNLDGDRNSFRYGW